MAPSEASAKGWDVDKVDAVTKDGKTSYIARIKKDHTIRELEVDSTGKILKNE